MQPDWEQKLGVPPSLDLLESLDYRRTTLKIFEE